MTDNLERVEKIILNMDCNKTDNISNRSSSSKRVIINLSKQSNITNSSNETIQLKKKSINEENYNSNKIKVAVKINNEMKLKNFNSNDTRKAIPKDHNHKKQVDLLIQKMRSLREEELKKKQLQKTINRENNVNYIQINFYTNKSDKASKETSLRKVKCDKDTTEKVSFNAAFNNESSKIKLSKSRSTISKKKVDRDITPKPNMIFNNKSKGTFKNNQFKKKKEDFLEIPLISSISFEADKNDEFVNFFEQNEIIESQKFLDLVNLIH